MQEINRSLPSFPLFKLLSYVILCIYTTGLSYSDFADQCAAAMQEINRTRDKGGTREMKGIYPLLFSGSTGYR
jgi:hypothetical protein